MAPSSRRSSLARGGGDSLERGGDGGGGGGGGGGAEEREKRRFTEEQLDEMLYEWDEEAFPVVEYHVVDDGGTGEAEADVGVGGSGAESRPAHEKADSERDSAEATSDDIDDDYVLAKIDGRPPKPKEERKVYLDLPTAAGDPLPRAHVVEFYEPWCPHCLRFKPHFVAMAAAVRRRTVSAEIDFYAVSCSLYRTLCRTYGVSGYPTVLGWRPGEDVAERGVELNDESMAELTADTLGERLGVELASEPAQWQEEGGEARPGGSSGSYSNSNDRRARREERMKQAARTAAETRRARHEQSARGTLNDRYRDAALSLSFALRTGVFDTVGGALSWKRRLALRDFLELVDWAAPRGWAVRTGLVRELLAEFDDVAGDDGRRDGLVDLVERQQRRQRDVDADYLWGYIEAPAAASAATARGKKRKRKRVTGLGGDVPDAVPPGPSSSSTPPGWSESCTHSKPAAGYTCGLWTLLHILTIGASLPDHQLYGFRSGYLTSPENVASIIRDFIANFFGCDVCRWNFVDSYDRCDHGRCDRLPAESPVVLGGSSEADGRRRRGRGRDGIVGRSAQLYSRELALWLFEAHNAVNVRLMREGAERDGRRTASTDEEVMAGLWPTRSMCGACWIDEAGAGAGASEYDGDAVFELLRRWYWPQDEGLDTTFDAVLSRRIVADASQRESATMRHGSSICGPTLTNLILICIIFAAVFKVTKSDPMCNCDGGGRRKKIEDLKKPPARNGKPFRFKRPPPRRP